MLLFKKDQLNYKLDYSVKFGARLLDKDMSVELLGLAHDDSLTVLMS